jgi:hypothetical protein
VAISIAFLDTDGEQQLMVNAFLNYHQVRLLKVPHLLVEVKAGQGTPSCIS